MHSAQVISKATANFFDDLHDRASQVMKILEESQIERFHQLVNFEKMFKVRASDSGILALGRIKADECLLT